MSKGRNANVLLFAPLTMAMLVAHPILATELEASPSPPALRAAIGHESLSSPAGASVESFFQISQRKRCGAGQSVKQDSQMNGSGQHRDNAGNSAVSDNRPVLKEVGRALWHVLDNAGVPMLVGKNRDLDPDIDMSHLMLPTMVPNLKRVDKPVDNPQQTVIEGSTQIDNGAIHKIPQSELEGVELPTLHDAQTPIH